MKSKVWTVAAAALLFVFSLLRMSAAAGPVRVKKATDPETARIIRGLQIAPVPLSFKGKDRNQVGLGSYIVNAQGGCNDCHTNPPYAPGGDPYAGEPKKINAESYLAGGTPFGPDLVSANITPDENGLPHGFTQKNFRAFMRSGHPFDNPGEIVQVMPWPIYGEMTDYDLNAVYQYLSAIPHAEPAP